MRLRLHPLQPPSLVHPFAYRSTLLLRGVSTCAISVEVTGGEA
jgi:hypothetical protein